ncbi:hypothetical protein AB7254_17660 [Providencia rettgeri]
MEISISAESIAEIFHEVVIITFNISDEQFLLDDGTYTYTIDGHRVTFSINEIQNEIDELVNYTGRNGTEIFNGSYFEAAVRPIGNVFGSAIFEYGDKNDTTNQLTYSIGFMSIKSLIYILEKVNEYKGDESLNDYFKRLNRAYIRYSFRIRKIIDDIQNYTHVFQIIPKIFPNIRTVKIISGSATKKNIADFENYSTAFLFEICYNMNLAIMPLRDIQEMFRISSELIGLRRSSYDDLDAPKRHYIKDLVHHYQQGVSANDPLLEYISFYHIAEHFFESVYQDEVINTIREDITHPDFSYKRKTDIKKLIKTIKSLSRNKEDGIGVSELEALEYTIIKFVDISKLKVDLINLDVNIYNNYINNDVTFSSGMKINFENSDEAKIIKEITKRIYSTRNAIVHSKDGDKGKYLPFSHEKELAKEIPLIRFISEQILINNSKIVN